MEMVLYAKFEMDSINASVGDVAVAAYHMAD